MVGKSIKVGLMISLTDGFTEQLNVFGRNLNTVIWSLSLDMTVSIAYSDYRSRAMTGSVTGGLRLQVSTSEQARWYGRKL